MLRRLLPLLIGLVVVAPYRVSAEILPVEQALREISDSREPSWALNALEDEIEPPISPGFSPERLQRLRRGGLSLLLPGLGQWRSGHHTRAFFFGAIEAGIWSSWGVFKIQGSKREESYQDFAQIFAGAGQGSQGDAYWRAVAVNWRSDDYNLARDRDDRAGIDEGQPRYEGDEAWRWRSEQRFDEYKLLRRDSIRAYDRADLVLALALVNRLASFVDAVRGGGNVPDAEGFHASVRPGPTGAKAQLSFLSRF